MIFESEREIKGPLPSFLPTHILKAILVIDRNYIGRKALARELSLGEGAVRTMLSKMKNHGIVKCERRGCSLTKKGRELYRKISSHLSISYNLDIPYAKPYNCAIVLRAGGRFVRKGLEERDMAIVGGAKGASLFILKSGDLWMPGLENLSEKYPEITEEILSKLEIHNGDAVLLAWADDLSSAEYGALNAALYLLKRMGVV